MTYRKYEIQSHWKVKEVENNTVAAREMREKTKPEKSEARVPTYFFGAPIDLNILMGSPRRIILAQN